jgi:hypothetical protein
MMPAKEKFGISEIFRKCYCFDSSKNIPKATKSNKQN